MQVHQAERWILEQEQYCLDILYKLNENQAEHEVPMQALQIRGFAAKLKALLLDVRHDLQAKCPDIQALFRLNPCQAAAPLPICASFAKAMCLQSAKNLNPSVFCHAPGKHITLRDIEVG